MTAAKSVVEKVVFDALSAAIAGAAVYQDAPDDAPLPVVILGDMQSRRLPTKGSDHDRAVTIQLVTMVEADERAPLLALQEQIDTALDGQSFEADGWTVSLTFEDDDATLAEDGTTYVGITTFSALTLADD